MGHDYRSRPHDRHRDPAPGGPRCWSPQERPVPAPGEREILVKVAAAGVNRPDVMQRQGSIRRRRARPIFPASKSPARWSRCGAGVSRWKLGDQVMALVVGGGYAEYLHRP